MSKCFADFLGNMVDFLKFELRPNKHIQLYIHTNTQLVIFCMDYKPTSVVSWEIYGNVGTSETLV